MPAPSYMGINQRFGVKLAKLRKERGYSQMKLAIAANTDRSYISDIERGEKSPTLEKLYNIAYAFGMTLEELVSGLMD